MTSTPDLERADNLAPAGSPHTIPDEHKMAVEVAPEAARPPVTDTSDMKALLDDIRQNPERIMDASISVEQILELQKQINPYAFIAGNKTKLVTKHVAAVSYTNLRADYIKRFTM